MKTLREKAPPDEIEACVKAEVAHHDFTVPILAQVPSRRHTRVPSHFQDFRGVPGLAKAPAEVEGSNLKKAKTDDCASSSCSDAYSGHHDKFPASTQTQTCSRRNARVPSHFDDFHGVPGLSSYSFKEETPRKQRATAAPLAIASPAANLAKKKLFAAADSRKVESTDKCGASRAGGKESTSANTNGTLSWDDAQVLCDKCDGGFHVYCLKPKLKSIPDGDWLCAECSVAECSVSRRRYQRKRPLPLAQVAATTVAAEDEDEEQQQEEEEEKGEELEVEDERGEWGGDGSKDYCEVCGGDGELVCCDYCECAYHGPSCLSANVEDLPDPWKCPRCSHQLSKIKAEYKKRKAAAKSASNDAVERGEEDTPVAIDAQRFDPVEQAAKMHAHLREHGFVVVKAVANEKEIRVAKTLLWDYLEECGQVDRDDPESWWCDKEWAPNSKDGIIYGRGVGQSDFMWHLRLLLRVRQAFAAVWSRVDHDDTPPAIRFPLPPSGVKRNPKYPLRSRADEGGVCGMQQEPHAAQANATYGFRARTSGSCKEMACGKRQRNGEEATLGTAGALAKNIQDDLLVSFDGAVVYRPWREHRLCRTKGGWYHVDQNYWNVGRQGFACVQGMVALTDVHEGTGGLVLIPGSHKKFKKLSKLKRVKDEYEDRSEDYVRFEKTDLDRVLAKRKMVPSLVRVRAGDMILWDSRVVHSGAPGWFSGQGGAGKKVRKVGGTTFPELAHQWLESQTELLRMAAYICMMPARRIPPHRLDHVLDVRQRIFKRGWATTHWPLEPTLGAKEEKPKVEAEEPTNEVQRRLIGFR